VHEFDSFFNLFMIVITALFFDMALDYNETFWLVAGLIGILVIATTKIRRVFAKSLDERVCIWTAPFFSIGVYSLLLKVLVF
jgi:hypothetical protein